MPLNEERIKLWFFKEIILDIYIKEIKSLPYLYLVWGVILNGVGIYSVYVWLLLVNEQRNCLDL